MKAILAILVAALVYYAVPAAAQCVPVKDVVAQVTNPDAAVLETLSGDQARTFSTNLGDADAVDLVIVFHMPARTDVGYLVFLFKDGCYVAHGVIAPPQYEKLAGRASG